MRLQPQPAKVLGLLLSRAGTLVSREEIQRTLWHEQSLVDFDQGLNYCIRQIRSVLGDNAETPVYLATVPRRGYRFLAEVSPVQAASESKVFEAPPEPAPLADSPTTAPRFGKRLSWWMGGLLVAAACLTLGTFRLALFAPGKEQGSKSGPVVIRPSVLVPAFQNLNGQSQDGWLTTALPEMMSTELSAGNGLRVFKEDEVIAASQGKAGKSAPADYILRGSYLVLQQDGQLRVDLKLERSSNAEVVTAVAETGSVKDLFRLVTVAGRTLRQSLLIPLPSEREVDAALASLSSNETATRYYAQGLQELKAYDAAAAVRSLTAAIHEDPDFVMAHASLATAWQQLGYGSKAQAEAEKAHNLSGALTREQKLLLEAQYRSISKELEQAVGLYRSLFTLHPDNQEFGILLANAQLSARDFLGLLQTTKSVRSLPGALAFDAELSRLEAFALSNLGEPKESAEKITHAAAVARKDGKRSLLARVLRSQCYLQIQSTDFQAARSSCEEAQRVSLSVGDKGNAAIMLSNLGTLDENQTLQFTKAMAEYAQSAQILHEVGNEYGEANALVNEVSVLLLQGNMQEADRLTPSALQAAEQSKNVEVKVTVLEIMAQSANQRGDILLGQSIAQKAAELAAETHNNYGEAWAQMMWGDGLYMAGDLRKARTHYQTALALRTGLNATLLTAESRMGLMQAAIDEKSVARGDVTTLEKDAAAFEAAHLKQDVLETKTLLAEAHAMLGEIPKALECLPHLSASEERNVPEPSRLVVQIGSARVQLMADHPEEAFKIAQQARDEAAQYGFTYRNLEARQLMAQAALQLGRNAGRELMDIQRAAESRGYLLVAQRAQVVLQASSTHQIARR